MMKARCAKAAPDSGAMLVRAGWAGFVVFALLLVLATPLPGRPDGTAIPGETGTVVENPTLCATAPDCHVGPTNTLNTVASVTINGVPERYQPGQAYDLSLEITGHPIFTRVYGFQLAAFFEDDTSQAGTLQPQTPGTLAFNFGGRQLLTHSDPLDSGQIAFRWIAPEQALGPVVLRVASNAANNNSDPGGDHIATQEVTVLPESQLPALEDFYFAQVGVGNQSGVRFDTELIFVNPGETTPLEIDLLDRTGQPFPVDIRVGGTTLSQQSRFEAELGPGQALKMELSSNGAIQAGYARVRARPEVGGIAVFTQRGPDGRILYEAGVPASGLLQEFSLAAQLEAGFSDTGLALVHPGAAAPASGQAAQLTLRLYDSSFQLLDEEPLTLSPGQHLPSFLSELFPTLQGLADGETFEGSVTVQSSLPIAAVTLRQTLVPTLTAFPVIEGSASP